MRNIRFALTLIIGVFAGVVALFALMITPVQANAQDRTGAVPRMASGRPDLSGVWWRGADIRLPPLRSEPRPIPEPGTVPPVGRGGGEGGPLRRPSFAGLYQPWAVEKAATLSDRDDPTLRCVPVAFGTLNVSLWGVGAVGQIIQSPDFVVLLTETYHSFKIIPTDGRSHDEFQPASYRGDSVGHWEEDTLVVETINFTDTNWMSAEGIVSFHSDQLRIVERYTRPDATTLQVDAIVYDAEVLTEPWIVPQQILELAPFDRILEVGCSGVETQSLMDAAADRN